MKAEQDSEFTGIHIGVDGLKFIRNGQVQKEFTASGEFVDYGCPFCRNLRNGRAPISFSVADVVEKRVEIDLCPECGCFIPKEVKQNGFAISSV